ncbi:MAG: hypothetical protein WCL32_00330 [Planctomycetota bacterium]|jgi:hypothetical protein
MEGGIVAGIMGFVCLVVVLAIVVAVLYLLTLQKALRRCAPRNRTMEPGMVWLNLVPFLNLFWMFKTVISVGDSLKQEFVDRNIDDGSDYGKSLGIWMGALQIGSSVLSNAGSAAESGAVSGLGFLLSIVALILFIIYWVRIAGYSRIIATENDRRDDRFDDDDDFRSPSPRSPGSTDIRAQDDRIR